MDIEMYSVTVILSFFLRVTNLVSCQQNMHLRVLENRILRIMFVLRRDEVTGGWRKLHKK
jgi:hypothetical protein